MAGALMKIFESILSKLGELIFAFAHNHVSSTNELELTLKTLQTALRALSARASDVEEQIKNAERSGRKKRKLEVEEWLADVSSIRADVAELVARVEAAGFIRRMVGLGDVKRLCDQVKNLIDQSRHFGKLILDVSGAEAPVKVCSIKRKVDGISLKLPNTLKRLFIECAFEPSKKRRSAYEEGPRLFPLLKNLEKLRYLTPHLGPLRNGGSVSILTNLTVLVLNGCFGLKHLPYLGELKALKALDVSDTGIKELPREVEELLHLETIITSSVYPLPRASGFRHLSLC